MTELTPTPFWPSPIQRSAEAMHLDTNLRERLKLPQRSLSSSVCRSGWMMAAWKSSRDTGSHDTARGPRRAVSGTIRR